MKKKRNSSPFIEGLIRQSLTSQEQSDLSRHKKRRGWLEELKKAKDVWITSEHDEAIYKIQDEAHEDELRVAVMWECFRHLYFSGRLSSFWVQAIEGSKFNALERYWKNTTPIVGYLSESRESFAAPWNLWADHPEFPIKAWSTLSDTKIKASALRAVDYDPPPVFVLKDDLYGWSHVFAWNRDCEGKINHHAGNLTLPKPKALLEMIDGNTSTVAFKIKWDSLSKEDLLNGVWNEIEKLWQSRNPKKLIGRPSTLRRFFDALVIRRRLDRGVDQADACQGTAYNPQKDGRQKALNAGAKKALQLVDNKLKETLETLQKIEQCLAGTEVR